MKSNKKMILKTKDEKRRLAFEKRNVKREQNLACYGAEGGSALVMAKTTEFNRRIIAAVLALVFAISCLVVGINFAARAEEVEGFNMLERTDDSGLVTRKGLHYNEANDTYDLRMEAYATKNLAQKTLDDKTPLDIVMVLQEGTSMAEQDVLQGYNASSATSFSINDAKTKYYLDDGVYYPLQVDRVYAPVLDNEGERTIWTAQEAFDWSVDNSKLYYLNGNTYQEVKYLKDVTYINRNDNRIYTRDLHHTVWGPHNYTTSQYINVPVNGKTDWHELKYNETGRSVTGFGYFYTFYYYTNVVTSSADYEVPSSARAGATAGSGNSQVSFLNDYESIVYRSAGIQENTYYEHTAGNGNLYTQGSVSQKYNYLYTDSYVLASQAPDSQDSEDYEGLLYYYGYQLFYTKDGQKHYVGSPTVRETDVAISDGTLYEEDIITRQAALKSVANQFAEQIAEDAATSNIDHRIAVVGYATNGDIKSGLVSAKEDDGDDENHVNDVIDSAINGLGASGGNNLTSGLNSAKATFDTSTIDSSNRKRIAVVFADASVSSSSDALAEANSLKDTYNASVYTVGLNNNNEDFLRKVSSEYFYTQQTNNGTYYYRAKDAYSDATGVPVSGIEPLADAFSAVFGALKPASITTTLDATNAMLKDVISANFNTENITSTTVQTAESQYSDGVLSWKTAQSAGLTPNWSEDGKTFTVEGFDYSANYVNYETENHPGKKIIVTITGLKLNEKVKTGADKKIYSNEENCGVYKKDAQEDILMGAFLRPYVDNISEMAPAGGTGVMQDGVVVNKYLTPNNNGKYDLTLEAYTTVTNQTKVEKVPTDFVIVVDQSGSMSTADMPTGYTAVSGSRTIEQIAEGSYYVQAADGNYYRVYATKDYLYRYYPPNYWFTGDIVDRLGTNLGWFMGETESSTTFANQFYFRESANGKTYYRPITTTIEGKIGTYYMKFRYDSMATGQTVEFDREDKTYSPNGNSPWYHNLLNGSVMKSGAAWWAADKATQGLYTDDKAYTYSELASIRTGMYVNYPMYERKVGYKELRYRDVNGVEHTLAATNGQSQWEFCNASGQALTTNDGSTRPGYTGLYQASGNITRLQALKNALTDFTQTISEDVDGDNNTVDNKIAIVGFSSEASDSDYNNTEILTGENLTIRNNNGVQMRDAGQTDYATALVSATQGGTVGTVNGKLDSAISALTANGGTQPEYGLQMANQILASRSNTTYTIKYGSRAGQEVPRNTIVIFFTDGQPGDYSYSNQYEEANEVVEAALPIKQSGTTVFSIGVFGESDGNPLTYTHEKKTSEDPNWEYLGGWVENYRSGNYYYALRRQWRSGGAGYTPTANDTIYDYMSVTSSNYPTAADYIAPGWLNNNFSGTYTDATDGVRNGSAETTVNNHYRMASNQDTLIAAFAQAATMMNDTISDNVRLDSSAILRDIMKDGSFVASPSSIVTTSTVNGSMDKNGVVTFESTSNPITLSQTPTYTDGVLSAVDVKGFDYLANYINYGTGTGEQDIHYHEGKKLVVTITDVYPDGANSAPNGDTLVYSNKSQNTNDSSALFAVSSGNETKVQDFPEPAIRRHSYTLNVGDINTRATFDVSVGLVTSGGTLPDLTDDDVQDDLKDVMIVFPNGERYNYLAVGPQFFDDMKDGDTFYFENVPQGYQVKTGVTTTDDSYVYHINFDGGTSRQMNVNVEEATNFSFDNHNINITSERSKKNVTIWEQTIGSYSWPDQVFDEVVTMQIPVSAGTQIPNEFRFDTTFTGDYHGYNNDTLPKNADEYKAVFTWDGQPAVDGKVTATLTAIESKKNGTTYTYPTTNGLPMRHDDRVTFSVPTDTTVTVAEPETHTHDVTFYSSKDDIAPEAVSFETASGTPITGEYDMTFVSVDGINAASQSVTFEDGSVTSTSNTIDFAPYQSITFTSDEDIGYPVLNINGTKLTFVPEEISEGEYLYTADIKRSTTGTPISATVEKDHVDILVVNEKGEIPVEGIFSSDNHNWIIYILAALGGIAAVGAGIFLWKKKDEFVEQ